MTATAPETKSYKLGESAHDMLCEALRRFECFAVRQDRRKWTISHLMNAWTGLGSRTTYKWAIDAGLMTVAPRTTVQANPGHTSWWSLTEEGARIVLAWHNAGFVCGKDAKGYDSFELKTPLPPRVGEYTVEDEPTLALPKLTLTGAVENLSVEPNSRGHLMHGTVQFFGVHHHVRFFRVNDRPEDEKAEWLVEPPADAPPEVKELFEDVQQMWEGAYHTMTLPGLPGLYVMVIFPFAE
jgi:hypothetical protein